MSNSAIPNQAEAWIVITAPQTLVVGQRVLTNGGAQLSLPLPVTFPVGAIFEIGDMSGFGWTVTQNAGQQIQHFGTATTLGVGGSISGAGGKTVKLVAEVANTTLRAVTTEGSITIV